MPHHDVCAVLGMQIEKLVEQLVADNPVRAIQVFPKLLRASQERWEHWFNHVFSHCDDAGTCCCSSKG